MLRSTIVGKPDVITQRSLENVLEAMWLATIYYIHLSIVEYVPESPYCSLY